IALEAARESITLLKNEKNVLPFAKNKKVLVIGPNGNSLTALNGAWSYTWQGQKPTYFSKEERTISDAMKIKIGNENVSYQGWYSSTIVPKAKEEVNPFVGDYILMCIGEGAYAETPGNINNLDLPSSVTAEIQDIKNNYKGIPLIILLTEGRPRIIREIEPLADAIILAYWPGSQGGNAIADVLYGDYNPCGKLPFTYPKYSGDILTYDHKLLDEAVEVPDPYSYTYKFDPQWPFGFGLRYTTFEYSDLKLSNTTLKGNDKLKVSVTVKNTGKVAGKETVELYSRDLYASVTPSVKRLRAFKKIYLEAGAAQTVEFEISREDLAFVNAEMKWVTEPGGFELMVGPLKAAFSYTDK
ncbi:MAG: glycoside hydrolase family 3 C-terminal domain-containing protein, partial [Cytophagaceae bacterium]